MRYDHRTMIEAQLKFAEARLKILEADYNKNNPYTATHFRNIIAQYKQKIKELTQKLADLNSWDALVAEARQKRIDRKVAAYREQCERDEDQPQQPMRYASVHEWLGDRLKRVPDGVPIEWLEAAFNAGRE